jgi:hypothetical protein
MMTAEIRDFLPPPRLDYNGRKNTSQRAEVGGLTLSYQVYARLF